MAVDVACKSASSHKSPRRQNTILRAPFKSIKAASRAWCVQLITLAKHVATVKKAKHSIASRRSPPPGFRECGAHQRNLNA